MNLQDQVVSLELAKQLKSEGYKQEGLWWWRHIPKVITGGAIISAGYELLPNSSKRTYASGLKCKIVAPTVAELGEALPNKVVKNKKEYGIEITKEDGYWCIQYFWDDGYDGGECLGHQIFIDFEATTEADARAKMWLYLKKERLL